MSATISERGRASSTLASATGLRPGISVATRSASGATTGVGLLAKIGAGCGPFCMNSALTRIAAAAKVATPAAIESIAWPAQQPGRKHGNAKDRLRIRAAKRPRRTRRRCNTRCSCCSHGSLSRFVFLIKAFEPHLPPRGRTPDERRSRALAPVVWRPAATVSQLIGSRTLTRVLFADLDLRSSNLAAVQRHQPLYDREPEAGAVVAAIVGAAGLEERPADARKIVGADTDAGILDRHDNIGGHDRDGDRDAAATLGELDSVGNEIEQDLPERTFVRDEFRQTVRRPRAALSSKARIPACLQAPRDRNSCRSPGTARTAPAQSRNRQSPSSTYRGCR